MEVSSIRVKLVDETSDRLRAVCSVTFDEVFVIRDVKVVDGTSGLFVAMPSRKLSANCPKCRYKNHLKARFCNDCGTRLPHHEIPDDSAGRSRLHRDVAHPITPEFRAFMQETVIAAYEEELNREPEPDEANGSNEHRDDSGPAPGNVREPEVVETIEEEDEDDGPQPGNDSTEFDEIIAGLGKGSGDRGRAHGRGRGGERERSDRGGRSGSDRGGRSGGRGGREERSGVRKGSESRVGAPSGGGRKSDGAKRRESAGTEPVASGDAPAPKPRSAEVVKKAEKAVTPSPQQSTPAGGFGAGILDADSGKQAARGKKRDTAKPAAAKKAPEPKKEKAETAPPPTSGGFGEGIL